MSFASYSEYKDPGVAWLRELPTHWHSTRLANLFREIDERGSDELPVLTVSIHDGVSDSELDENELDRKVTRSDDRSKYKRVAPGDLVYNMMRAWQGGFGTVLVNGMVSPAYVVARPNDKLLSTAMIVEHQLRTPQAVEEMRRHSRGVTDFRLRLYWDEFKNISVAVPPKGEQLEICRFIDRESAKIDALVEEQMRLIELLKEKRQAVISQAVTKGLDPSVPMKDSGVEWLGRVPAHWEICALKRAFDAMDYGISDSLDVDGRVAVLRMGNISDGEVGLGDLKYVDSVDPSLLLRNGDLLFNRTNSLDQIGKVGLFAGNPEGPTSFASYLVRLRTTAESVPGFFSYLLNCPGLLAEARANAIVAIGQCNLNPSRYGSFVVALPPQDEQLKIAEFLNSVRTQVNQLKHAALAACAVLQERRVALISAAVTGKIDVRGLVPQPSQQGVAACP